MRFHKAILRLASLLVPSAARPAWLNDWTSELWYVSRAGGNAARFCSGAFRDAWLLRRDNPALPRIPIESAAQCLSLLGALAVLSILLTAAIPSARRALTEQFTTKPTHANSGAFRVDRVWIKIPNLRTEAVYLARPTTPWQSAGLVVRSTRRLGRVGSVVFLYGAPVRIIAESSESGCRLPGGVDVLLTRDGAFGSDCQTIRAVKRLDPRLLLTFIPNLLTACFIVPASISLAMRDLIRIRRLPFLAAKIALILPILFFGALDLASSGLPVSMLLYESSLFGGIFALRWALLDQRQRCPVCLRLLTNPVHIGSSHILLEWEGTELMCPHGHGLMHVAESSAVWFSGQRWVALDASWSALFR